jgi:integrase
MASKRANGEGSVHKRADGRWQAVVTLPTGKRKYYYAKTQAEASAARTKALYELARGMPIVAEKQTLEGYLAIWMESVAHDRAPRTFARYQQMIAALPQAILHTRLAKLTPHQLQALYAAKLAQGWAPGTVRYLHAVLHCALDEAFRLGLVPRNVADLARPPKPARTEMQVLSPEEARTLLAAMDGDRLEALYVVALTTGMRLGELLALRWVDVDLHGGAPAVHVRATLRYRNARTYFFDPPKTRKSRRRIALSTTAVAALRSHRARQLEERLAAGFAWREEDLVFCAPDGGPLSGTHLVQDRFVPSLARAGLPRIRFHDLRHTAATLLLRGGVHPKVVSEMLGHTTVAMTLDRYSHVLPDMQEAATAVMDRLLG